MTDKNKFVWAVYTVDEHIGGVGPEAIFGSFEDAKKYVKDNNDEDGWLEIAKYNLTTGLPVTKNGSYTK